MTLNEQLIQQLSDQIERQQAELIEALQRVKYLEIEVRNNQEGWKTLAKARADVQEERMKQMGYAEAGEFADLAYAQVADERDMYRTVLTLIAEGATNPTELAAEALTTSVKIKYQIHEGYLDLMRWLARHYLGHYRFAKKIYKEEREDAP